MRIEPSSNVPISRQIADQIRAQCATGALPAGSRLPSVRGLARELAVNQNTILKVYERLQMEGLLELRHGDGTYVAARPPAGQLKVQRALLRKEMQPLVYRAATLGLTADDLRDLVADCFGRLSGPDGGSQEEGDE